MKIRALLAGLACLLVFAASGRAISNGTWDGENHPYVGAVVYRFGADKGVGCSGTLISPTVFVTAAHCLSFLPEEGLTVSDLSVSFSSDLRAALNDIPAVDYHIMPGFGDNQSDPRDLGVIILPAGSTAGIAPAVLPTADLLDRMSSHGGLIGQIFDNVGYGVIPSWKRGPFQIAFDGKRNFSTSPFRALSPTRLTLLMNNNATGMGGVCFGDSGSGHFFAGTSTIVSTTIGGDARCRALNVNYRLDTPAPRAFLQNYVTLP